jgi:hypothetical protein
MNAIGHTPARFKQLNKGVKLNGILECKCTVENSHRTVSLYGFFLANEVLDIAFNVSTNDACAPSSPTSALVVKSCLNVL